MNFQSLNLNEIDIKSKRNSLNGNGYWTKTQHATHLAQCMRGLPLAQPRQRWLSLARPNCDIPALKPDG
jgi:hypothetical protein